MPTKLCVKCGERRSYSQYGILKVGDKELFYQHCNKCKSEFDERRRKIIIPAIIPNIENEVWLPIRHFEGLYEISNLGRVKTVFRKSITAKGHTKTHINKILSQIICIYGYYHVNLYKNGKGHLRKVHRLVALHYVPNPNNLEQVNHIDGIKIHNEWYNLEWCTLQENIRHSIQMGLTKQKADDNPNSVVSNEQAIEIFNSKLPRRTIAALYNVNISVIMSIKIGRCYSSVTGKEYKKGYTKGDKEKILSIFNEHGIYSKIAQKYGVDFMTVLRIKAGLTYSSITGKRYKRTQRKLTNDEILDIYISTKSQKEISRAFRIGTTLISMIKNGRKYSNITNHIIV